MWLLCNLAVPGKQYGLQGGDHNCVTWFGESTLMEKQDQIKPALTTVQMFPALSSKSNNKNDITEKNK